MKTIFKRVVVWCLRQEARAVLKKYNPKIVAVTGSVGKTSTKDAIYTALRGGHRTRKSEKSFNSDFGLPLTILGVPNAWNNPLRWILNLLDGLFLIIFNAKYPEWLVLEAGADRPGDIRSLAKWLQVDIAVITRLPEIPVHVEFFESPEDVVSEKASLINALKPGGTLVLYADEERTVALAKRLPASHNARTLTFGFSEHADVRGEHFQLVHEEGKEHLPVGMKGMISHLGVSVPVEVAGSLGMHAFAPLLAAAAVGVALGKNLEEVAESLRSYAPPPGRMRLIRGLKESTLIDDTYNASPAAVAAALETLQHIKSSKSDLLGRRIAVLGDMLELGRRSVEEHRKVGALAAKCADLLVTIGFRSHDTAQGALDAGMSEANILQYEDSAAAGKELKNLIGEGDTVLLKGSQSMRVERATEELMHNPEDARKLLVRQEREWKKR